MFELRGKKENQEVRQKDQVEPNVPSVLISVVEIEPRKQNRIGQLQVQIIKIEYL